MMRTTVHRLSLLLGLLVVSASGAVAQTSTVRELTAFEPPFTIVIGAVAQLPDGRTYGFYAGGFNGGIYQVIADGHGGYTTALVLEFPEGAAGPPVNVFTNGRTNRTVAVGSDGKIYFSGAALSRFDPDTNTVDILHPFPTTDPTSLTLGNDGHTLFGSSYAGQIFSYDTVGGVYHDIVGLGAAVIGVVQMKDGTLLAVQNPLSDLIVTMWRLDPVTGAGIGSPIVQGRASALPPVKGDDGEVYVYSNVFGDLSVQRVDIGCFCLQILKTWLFPGPPASTMTGPRNGFIYINANYQLNRLNLNVTPPLLERLSDLLAYNYQLLPDGTLVMFDEAKANAAIIATAAPETTPTPLFAAAPPSDGADGFPSEFTQAADGQLYGVADNSRTQFGSIFRVDPIAGTRALVARIDYGPGADAGYGTSPAKMLLAPDGRLYGTYLSSGTSNSAIFQFDPATNAIERLHEFPLDQSTFMSGPDGAFVNRLTLGRDGWLYGSTQLGDDPDTQSGTIFKLDPVSRAFVTLSRPLLPNGFYPSGPMIESAPGIWIGTYYTSDYSEGAPCTRLFRFDAGTTVMSPLKDFSRSEGCSGDFVPLARASDGTLFGILGSGPYAPDFSSIGGGVLFTLNPDTGAVTTLHQFAADSAVQAPYADLAVGADGFLYSSYMVYDGVAGHTKGVVRFDRHTGEATPVAQLPSPAGYLGATGFFAGRDGRMYGATTTPWKVYAIGILDPLPIAPASRPFGGTTSVSTTLKALGTAMAGRTIAFTLNGHAIGSAITNAQGMATLNNVSLNGIAIGTHAGAIGASFAGDASFPATSGSGSLTVLDVPTPGLMVGDGFIRDDDANYAFAFVVREKPNGADRGAFALRVTDCDRGNGKNKKKTKPRDDQFVAKSYTSVVFSDDPSIRPGRRLRPQVDTVTFAGPGQWNGKNGYRFEAFAQDRGEPGRHRESLRVTIYDSTNHIVVQFDDELAGGNVQSVRLRH